MHRAVGLSGARRWSLIALLLGVAAAVVDLVVVIVPQAEKGTLVWPLIVLPLFFVPSPVVVPIGAVRICAAAAMFGWCWLAAFSLGPAFIPCLVAMIVAAAKADA